MKAKTTGETSLCVIDGKYDADAAKRYKGYREDTELARKCLCRIKKHTASYQGFTVQ